MKRIYLILLVAAIVTACTNDLDVPILNEKNTEEASLTRSHFVYFEDIHTYVNAQKSESDEADDLTKNVMCYVDEDNDTLLYIYDKPEGGWIVYSSDTRVPPVVATCDSSSYEKSMENEHLALWLNNVAKDMKAIKYASDSELNFTEAEIKANREFWTSISNPNELFTEKLMQMSTRVPFTPFVDGHYEFVETRTVTETLELVSGLTTTKWHQLDPYNLYCPYTSNWEAHAPAGCAAIAASQMLYFLHNKWGVPQTAPSQAYVNSNVNCDPEDYDWGQSNYTSSVWNVMRFNGQFAAPLIANVGLLSAITYRDNGSGTGAGNVCYGVFPAYGINCNIAAYNDSVVKSSIRTGMPVLIDLGGFDQLGYVVSHLVIADKYKRERTVTKNIYLWVYDSQPQNPDGSFVVLPAVPPREEYTYISPETERIGMNWGWNDSTDSEWFALTGEWLTLPYSWRGWRRMIYNFSIAP